MPRGARQELPRRSERDVASDRFDVDGHLAHRLGDVERVDRAARPHQRPDLGRVGDGADVGRHVGHEHEAHAVIQRGSEGPGIDAPVGQGADLDHLDAVRLREPTQRCVHRVVRELVDEDAVALGPAERLGHRPQRPLP